MDRKELAESISGFAVLGVFYAWHIFWVALAISCLFDWFAAPVFNMNGISITEACGLYILAGVFIRPNAIYDAVKNSEELMKKNVASIVNAPLSSILLLLVGYIIKGFL